MLMIFLFWSCQNEGDAKLSEQLSFEQIEQISINLSIGGEINPELLIGEWELIKFAFTADGKKISDVAAISSGILIPTSIDDDGLAQWCLITANSTCFIYSLEGNRIKLKRKGVSFSYVYVIPPNEEYDLISALNNAYSFVIKDNELMIYFMKEKDKEILSYCTVTEDKNLLILKRR